MQKLDMLTPDMVSQNIEAIAQLFPNIITEQEDADGNITKAIDYDLFRQIFSRELVEGSEERYRLDWPGKRASILKANTPIDKTLRPVVADSVNWDTTENLYIEGDNFEVLKVLQESYLGKVKMIYIDPPYNTGSDFVYTDNYSISKEEYEEGLEIVDEEGGRLVKNTDTNGRFHSDWLSMMYERLVVARDLLRNDGVLFISIDDNEAHNLRKICDDIFGVENFISQCIWQHSIQPKAYENRISGHHNYTLIYKKSDDFILGLFDRTDEDNINYSNPDNDPKGYWRTGDVRSSYAYRENLMYNITSPNGNIINSPEKGWRWSEDTMNEKIRTGEVIFNKTQTSIIRKIYLGEQGGRNPESIWFGKKFGTTRTGTKTIQDLFDTLVFDTPKPVELIENICIVGNIKNDDIVLDFFSGSCTTAHALIKKNAEDGGNRKFIMVQIPEETSKDSEAYKAGYVNICEIGKERIRRAGKKILEENKDKEGIENLDTGFRVYRLDSSNMKDVFYHPTEVTQAGLFDLTSNIKDDRTPEDILAQVMLDLGLTLDLSIETRTIAGSRVFLVAGNSLVACFDEEVDFSIVDELASLNPLKVVFRDSSFQSDADRINFETRFKKLSPDSDLRVI